MASMYVEIEMLDSVFCCNTVFTGCFRSSYWYHRMN